MKTTFSRIETITVEGPRSKNPVARGMSFMSVTRFVGASLAVFAGIACVGSELPPSYHVGLGGEDTNPGTVQKPFATLLKARDSVRANRLKGEAVSVIIHGGIYRLERSLEFNDADSGTASSPVLWKAAPGETVRLTGGQSVPADSIKPVTDEAILKRVISVEARKHLLQIDLAALGIKEYGQVGPRGFSRPYMPAPLELFIAGRPMSLARWPNAGEALIPIGNVLDTGSITRNGEKPVHGGKFVVPTTRPKLWSKADDILISGLFHYGYADDTVRLAAITESKNGLVFTTVQPHVYGFKSGSPWNTWYALNLLEEIDLPGEYAVDRESGKLYFLPPKDVVMQKAEVMVSTLAEPLIVLEGASHLRFEGITFECSRGMGIYIEGGESCVMSSCVFHNLGMQGVCIGRGLGSDPLYRHDFTGKPLRRQLGSWNEHIYKNPDFNRIGGRNHRIEDCSLYDLGAGGISLGGGDRKSLTAANNTVSYCVIHTFNRWDRAYKAGINLDGVGNRIQHCLIYDAPGSAIYLHGNDHLIEHNEFHHVMEEGDDMGAVYLGRDPSEFGTVNRILHAGASGITLNHYAQHIRIAGNEIGWTGSDGIFLEGYGPGTLDVNKNNVITRNWLHDHGLGNYWHSPSLQIWQSGHNEITLNLMQRSAYTAISITGADPFGPGRMSDPAYFFEGSAPAGQFDPWNMFNIRSQDFPADLQEKIRRKEFKFDRDSMKPYIHSRDNRIAHNILVESETILTEGGVIYAWWCGTSNVWQSNAIFKSSGMPASSVLALDDGAEFTTVTDNVLWVEGPILNGVGARPAERGNTIAGNVRVCFKPEVGAVDRRHEGKWWTNVAGREPLDQLVKDIAGEVEKQGGWSGNPVTGIPAPGEAVQRAAENSLPKDAHATTEERP